MEKQDFRKKAIQSLCSIMSINEAQSEVDFILTEEFKLNKKDLLFNPEKILPFKARLDEIVKIRLEQRKPLQYILNKAVFYNELFYVDENVLIPRPETEILVQEVVKNANPSTKILDIGTGSGCIPIMCAKLLNNNNITSCDISKSAINIAKKNAKKITPQININFVHSDLFSNINEKFDIIVSNPPYIKNELKTAMEPEVLDFEPSNALFAEDDGLFFYKKIIKMAPNYLNNGGILAFESGINQANLIKNIMITNNFRKIIIIPDFSSVDRVVLGYYN